VRLELSVQFVSTSVCLRVTDVCISSWTWLESTYILGRQCVLIWHLYRPVEWYRMLCAHCEMALLTEVVYIGPLYWQKYGQLYLHRMHLPDAGEAIGLWVLCTSEDGLAKAQVTRWHSILDGTRSHLQTSIWYTGNARLWILSCLISS